MSVLTSRLDTRGTAYAEARDTMLAKLAELDTEHAKALAGGGERYVERHRSRGGLLARERVELLPETADLAVTRHLLPNLRAANFWVEGMLAPGTPRREGLDPQAKGVGEWLRARRARIPESLLPHNPPNPERENLLPETPLPEEGP